MLMLCVHSFRSLSQVTMTRNAVAGGSATLQDPALTWAWAAGYSFSKCHADEATETSLDPLACHSDGCRTDSAAVCRLSLTIRI